MLSLPFKLSCCQRPITSCEHGIRCFSQVRNGWGAILSPCTYYFVSFRTPFPSHFPWPFTHNVHVCSRATHNHFKKKLVLGGRVCYLH
jgi:hypothetical protein